MITTNTLLLGIQPSLIPTATLPTAYFRFSAVIWIVNASAPFIVTGELHFLAGSHPASELYALPPSYLICTSRYLVADLTKRMRVPKASSLKQASETSPWESWFSYLLPIVQVTPTRQQHLHILTGEAEAPASQVASGPAAPSVSPALSSPAQTSFV